jgi:hypothetical protein
MYRTFRPGRSETIYQVRIPYLQCLSLKILIDLPGAPVGLRTELEPLANRASMKYNPSPSPYRGTLQPAPIEALPRGAVSMALQAGRSDKRIRQQVAVELVRSDDPRLKETGIIQNRSARGMRVETRRAWRQGERVLLADSGLRSDARVVYCQRLENDRFALGLEILSPPPKRTRAR